jgi:hypothetical protein
MTLTGAAAPINDLAHEAASQWTNIRLAADPGPFRRVVSPSQAQALSSR